ncbi:MAG: peptidase S41 [Piscinibacter sp.]|nr:peptidase S41 [Piscinibacter sp.]
MLAAVLLAACGGGGGGTPAPAASCDLATQQDWLRSYMLDWYLWSGRAPNPAPSGFDSLQTYFDALRFAGDATTRADVWSYYQDSASYNQFFAEGQTMGYGLFVNGNERQLPLRVRMVEPQGPAALAGLVRGDRIVSIDGVPDTELIQGDFRLLSPAQAGQQITVVAETAAGLRSVVLTAALYTLTPVPTTRVLPLGDGRKAGYLALKDFIVQAQSPVEAAFADFRSQGATELIIDLRYNGGGRVSTANHLASQVVGAVRAGQLFTELRYNAAHQNANNRFLFSAAPAPAFGRVVVLTGSRTCSASELIVNGLAPHVPVVTLGGTTCGKPYGFNPVASCGNTFSVVNFQSYNAADFADYDDGLAPTCPVAEDFTGTLGDPAETLTGAAVSYLETGACPVAAAPPVAAGSLRRRLGVEPGDRRGMTAD